MGTAPFVTLVGPTSPYRGGIVQHTTELATRLEDRGLLVEFAAWRVQFPASLHPGQTLPPESAEATKIAAKTTRQLHWQQPHTWVNTARRIARNSETLAIVVSSSLQYPAIRLVTSAFRRARKPRDGRVILIIHNVLPHERRTGDERLMRWTIGCADTVIVHSELEAERARSLGGDDVRAIQLPFHPPSELVPSRHAGGDERFDRLAFLGYVRHYKGLDIALRAVAAASTRAQLVIHGEFWEPIQRYRQLADELEISERIDFRSGFAATAQIMEILSSVDALVLPYRSATASQQPRIAFARGVPVIATDVGALAHDIRHDVDGLVVPVVDTEQRLAAAIDDFYRDEKWLRLRRGVRHVDPNVAWDAYIAEIRS